MPCVEDEPHEALKFLVVALLKDIQEAKMWPIKMTGMKNQEQLRPSPPIRRNHVLERIYTSLQPPHAAILSDEDTYIHNIVLLSCRITSSKRKPSS